MQPPIAKKERKELEIHKDIRVDEYYWMNQRDDAEVLDHLQQENAYFEEKTKHLKQLQNDIFQEIKSRIKEDDSSVPYLFNDYWYWIEYETGNEYPLYYRQKDEENAKKELLFDGNKMAEGQDYFNITGISVSPNNQFVAYGIDTIGRRNYTLYVKNLFSGEKLSAEIENTVGCYAWANDNSTLFYAKRDTETLRSDKIFRTDIHAVDYGEKMVYREKDAKFDTFVYRSKSQSYIIIVSSSSISDEYRLISTNRPKDDFQIFQPREDHLEYSIEHVNDKFYILTNADQADNFKLMTTTTDQTSKENWQVFQDHDESVLLEDVDVFTDFIVLSERSKGLNHLKVIPEHQPQQAYYIPVQSETYTLGTSANPQMNSYLLRFVFNSMTTPTQVIEYNMQNKTEKVLKQQEVPDQDFDPQNYRSRRIWVKSRDGELIPVSMVFHKNTDLSQPQKLLLMGYGSYGITVDPYFSVSRLSLLDRGFIYTIAHVRGGEYLGRQWYENGKFLKKKNTFNDFIDVSQFLIDRKYTTSRLLCALGGSAGGMLMGVILNEAPHLYKSVVAAVPFVDVLTTMLDDSIPLTTGEYDEWGNPKDHKFYHYMKSYSPYDNVKKQDYPNILITTGYHDSQVQYWEPAKWVAKLREHKTDDNLLLFYTEMDAGHSGSSGRFNSIKETARDFAFIIDSVDKNEK